VAPKFQQLSCVGQIRVVLVHVPVLIYRHHHPTAVHQVARSVCLDVILALVSQDAAIGFENQNRKA
jgi:hypothetical protein